MKKFITIFSFLASVMFIKSCLVPPSPRYHYFVSDNKMSKNDPKVTIFSTPKIKNYVITNISPDAEVWISSPAFEDSNTFYPLQNKSFFDSPAKQFILNVNDRKFYHTDAYKVVNLKFVSGDFEHTIRYRLNENGVRK